MIFVFVWFTSLSMIFSRRNFCIKIVIWDPQLLLVLVCRDKHAILNLGTGEELGFA